MLNIFYFHDNGYRIWTAKQFGSQRQEIIAIILFIMTKGLENYFMLSKIQAWKSEKIAIKEVIKSTHRKNQYTITFV